MRSYRWLTVPALIHVEPSGIGEKIRATPGIVAPKPVHSAQWHW
jgi:hypothetical protein